MNTKALTESALLGQMEFLRALARTLVGPGPDADDLAQDAALRGLRGRLRDEGAIRGFIRSVTGHTAINAWRSRARREHHETAARTARTAEPTVDLVARREVLATVVRRVMALEEPYSTVIMLRYYDGLSTVEIARRLAIPEGTVRSRLSRAIAQLREELDESCGGRERWALPLVPLGTAASGAKLGVLSAAAALLVIAVGVVQFTFSPRSSFAPTPVHEPRSGVPAPEAPGPVQPSRPNDSPPVRPMPLEPDAKEPMAGTPPPWVVQVRDASDGAFVVGASVWWVIPDLLGPAAREAWSANDGNVEREIRSARQPQETDATGTVRIPRSVRSIEVVAEHGGRWGKTRIVPPRSQPPRSIVVNVEADRSSWIEARGVDGRGAASVPLELRRGDVSELVVWRGTTGEDGRAEVRHAQHFARSLASQSLVLAATGAFAESAGVPIEGSKLAESTIPYAVTAGTSATVSPKEPRSAPIARVRPVDPATGQAPRERSMLLAGPPNPAGATLLRGLETIPADADGTFAIERQFLARFAPEASLQLLLLDELGLAVRGAVLDASALRTASVTQPIPFPPLPIIAAGKALSAASKPLGGVVIAIEVPLDTPALQPSSSRPAFRPALWTTEPALTGLTDEDGRFAIRGLTTTTRLGIRARSSDQMVPPSFTFDVGATELVVVFSQSERASTGTITGTVTFDPGFLIEGLAVGLRQHGVGGTSRTANLALADATRGAQVTEFQIDRVRAGKYEVVLTYRAGSDPVVESITRSSTTVTSFGSVGGSSSDLTLATLGEVDVTGTSTTPIVVPAADLRGAVRRIRLSVRDGADHPVPGAEVSFLTRARPAAKVGGATCGATGEASFVTAAAEGDLVVRAAGFRTARLPWDGKTERVTLMPGLSATIIADAGPAGSRPAHLKALVAWVPRESVMNEPDGQAERTALARLPAGGVVDLRDGQFRLTVGMPGTYRVAIFSHDGPIPPFVIEPDSDSATIEVADQATEQTFRVPIGRSPFASPVRRRR